MSNETKIETKIFTIDKRITEISQWNTSELDKLLNDGWKISNTIGENKIILIKKTLIVQ
jgi:hypothetical protein